MTNTSSTGRRRTSVSRVIEASLDRIYDAVLDPDALAEWFPPNGVTAGVHEFEPTVGDSFRITFSFEETEAVEGARTFSGTFLELESNERILHSEAFETNDPGLAGDVTVTFQDVAGGTEVTVLHEGLPDDVPTEDNASGWIDSFENRLRLVESI